MAPAIKNLRKNIVALFYNKKPKYSIAKKRIFKKIVVRESTQKAHTDVCA